jgi:hypothetical protein
MPVLSRAVRNACYKIQNDGRGLQGLHGTMFRLQITD